MRRTTSLTALLLGASLLAPTGAATAAGETCRGEAATIIGTGTGVQGTEGRDVIITGASVLTSAGAGDDVICVTGAGVNFNMVDVVAGPGNDVVDSTTMAAKFHLTAILGDGSDTFLGGAADERVVAGAAPPTQPFPPAEAERDVIDTGDGMDIVTSGGPGLSNDDVVRTGSDADDVTWSGTMGVQGVLDAGEGTDTLTPRASGQAFRIDLAAQTLARNGLPEAHFSSFERLIVAPEPDLGTVEILGTAGDDTVDILASATVRADLGESDDHLRMTVPKSGSRIDLGTGTDRVKAYSRHGLVGLDLTRGTLVVDGSRTATLTGVENAHVSARESTLIGNGGANVLSVTGCRTAVDGRGGEDHIKHRNHISLFDCERGQTTLRGGWGDDEIRGGNLADSIYGGAGHDRGVGGPGPDLCRTEIRRSCES